MSDRLIVYVPVAPETLVQLRERPSEPVTIQIQEVPDLGDDVIQFVCTRHVCPNHITVVGKAP